MMKRLRTGMVVLLCACGGGAKSLLDPAFGTMGSTVTTFSCPGNGISKSLVKTANGFVASGLGCEGWALVGYTEKGEVDPAFGDAGVALFFSGDGVFSSTRTLAVRSDGRLLVSGSKGSKTLLRQLSATGKVDDAFSAASEKEITDSFPASFEMALQPDGNLILAQGETMIRIKPDGRRDLTFGSLGSQRDRRIHPESRRRARLVASRALHPGRQARLVVRRRRHDRLRRGSPGARRRSVGDGRRLRRLRDRRLGTEGGTLFFGLARVVP